MNVWGCTDKCLGGVHIHLEFEQVNFGGCTDKCLGGVQ